jgi:Chemotaxis signal transduction protein
MGMLKMVTYQEQDFIPYMSDVEKYDRNLLALNDQWDNIKLLCEMNCPEHSKSILPSMTHIEKNFSELQKKLISTLVSEKLKKLEQKTISKAQVAVDILIRNLYERTADVGFLATDDDIRRFAALKDRTGQDSAAIAGRLREYAAKYSVYEDIVILDTDFTVIANLDPENRILGDRIDDPILRETLASEKSFVESFKASLLQPKRRKAHIFSRKIADGETGRAIGLICLCFRFENEMEGIFSKLCNEDDASVLTIIDENNRVIASSDYNHVPVGVCLEPVTAGINGIVHYRGNGYIAKTVSTSGYQGYYGLGWRGHILIPLRIAFKEKTSKMLDSVDPDTRTGLMNQAEAFSKDLNDIMDRTQEINKSLRRIVYNGQIIAKDGAVDEEYIRLKPLLNYINKIGTNIAKIFRDSVKNLFATVVTTSLQDAAFLALLSIDIMDRNLYERADDCRWWALDSTFRAILAHDPVTDADRRRLTEILTYINSLYTVYSNIFLFDRTGKIVAVSNPARGGDVGRTLGDGYVKGVLGNADAEKYFVSDFEKTPLYDGRPTYIYGASVTDVGNSRSTVGGIGLVFDSAFQFQNMLEDAVKSRGTLNAVYADRKGGVIASTLPDTQPGDRLQLPHRLFDVKNGRSDSEILVHNESYYAIGRACSSGYREYKVSDGYQNDVIAVVFDKLADFEQTDVVRKKISFLEQSSLPSVNSARCKKMATFFIDSRLLALDQGVVVEVIEADSITPVPECGEMVRGVTMYRDQYVTVLDTHFLFKQGIPANGYFCILIVRLGEEGTLAGLVVDQLNNVLEINEADIKPVPEMGGATAIVKGAACFEGAGNRFLLVLDEQKLLDQLNPEIERLDMQKLLPLLEEQTKTRKEIAAD